MTDVGKQNTSLQR